MTAPRVAAAVGAGLVVATAAVAADGGEAGSPWRHLYVLPVLLGAVRFGHVGGTLAALAAVCLDAPFVLREVARRGLGAPALAGLETFAILLLVGTLGGAVAARTRRERERYATLLALHRALGSEAKPADALERAAALLRTRLAPIDVGLVLRDGGRLIVTGDGAIAPDSLAARVVATGRAAFVADAGEEARPRRVFVAPLRSGGETAGALVVERIGELSGHERAAVATLAVDLALALDNARLAARQRRFTEELAAKVAEATQRLEQLDRTKSAFVATVSHELRTPLTALRGFSELLALRRFPPEEVRRFGDLMHRETERLVRIVTDLLDLSRLERGLPPTLVRSPVVVENAILAAAQLFRQPGGRDRIVVDCAPGLPPVHADADALDRVLKNLLSNALKYSAPGGSVRVLARAADANRVVRFEIVDDGPGIASDALPHLFEPYYRAPGAAERAPGAGLGLAVVKALVEAHGGTIGVDSAPARGTRVTFTIPAVP